MLLFEGVELIPQLDILVNLLINLAIFLRQLVESIFDSSELVQLLPGAVGQFLPNIMKTIGQDQAS
jgi:phage-related protein